MVERGGDTLLKIVTTRELLEELAERGHMELEFQYAQQAWRLVTIAENLIKFLPKPMLKRRRENL